MWAWLGLHLGKHAGIVAIVGVVLTIFFGYGITKLEFATGQDSYLNKSDTVYKDSVAYQRLFGGQAMLTLVTMDEGKSVVDLFTDGGLERWAAIDKQLEARDDLVFGVVTPRTALEFTDKLVASPSGNPAESIAGKILLDATERDPSPEGKTLRTKASVATLTRLGAIPPEQRVLTNRAYVDFLIHENDGSIRKALRPFFPDERHAQMIVRLPGNQDIEDEGKAADFVKEATSHLAFEGASITTTGAPVLLKDINDYLTGGMLTLGAIAVVIMVLILLLLFGVRWRLLPMGVILLGVLWAFGLAGYLGIPLTIVTIAGLPVMLGVGIDYAIQMHARVEEEVIIDRADHPIQETARNLGPALLVVTFDAVFAFAALRFSKVPMIRQFGLLLAVGIIVICIGSIVIPLAVLGIREYRSPTKGRDFREGFLGRMTVKLGSLSPKLAPALIIASILIFVGGVVVEGKLVLQTDPIQWVNQNSETIKNIHTVEHEVHSSNELGVFVSSNDVFSDEFTQFVHTFTQNQLAKYPEKLLTASSIESAVGDIIFVEGASDIAPTGEQVKAAYDVAPEAVQLSTANPEEGALNLVFRTGPSGLDERAVVVREIRDTTKPPEGVRATPSGLAVVGVGLLDNLEANRILLTYLAILF